MAKSIQGKIQTSSKVVPMIYAYTTPGITYHDGYIKIGYTEQDVDERIYQQTHTAGVKAKKEWQGTATFDDGTGDTFRDSDFHAYLRKQGVLQPQDEGNEFF
ncbi:MAG: GIY-YIG nuclease family protein, partial [Clostridia bacterium]|nr:GIY-YIG nuclease family protein [Clostridia bacterium]